MCSLPLWQTRRWSVSSKARYKSKVTPSKGKFSNDFPIQAQLCLLKWSFANCSSNLYGFWRPCSSAPNPCLSCLLCHSKELRHPRSSSLMHAVIPAIFSTYSLAYHTRTSSTCIVLWTFPYSVLQYFAWHCFDLSTCLLRIIHCDSIPCLV